MTDELTLRLVTQEDCELIYSWQAIPGIRQYFKNPAVPSYTDHQSWFSRRLESSIPFYMIQLDGEECGFVRLEKDGVHAEYEISILVNPEFKGKSIGSRALRATLLKHPANTFIATIAVENVASVRCFEKTGFVRQGDLFYYPPR